MQSPNKIFEVINSYSHIDGFVSEDSSPKSLYTPYKVYQNLPFFLSYRGLKLQNKIPEKEFVKDIQYYGYIMTKAYPINKVTKEKITESKNIESKNTKEKDISEEFYIFILDKKSLYAASSTKLAELLEKPPGIKNKKRVHTINIMIITYREVNVHLKKKVATYTNEKTNIMTYPYRIMVNVLPKHKNVPKQELVNDPKQIQQILRRLRVKIISLPQMKKTDPICIWINGKPGNLVRVYYPSESSVLSLAYFRVV